MNVNVCEFVGTMYDWRLDIELRHNNGTDLADTWSLGSLYLGLGRLLFLRDFLKHKFMWVEQINVNCLAMKETLF